MTGLAALTLTAVVLAGCAGGDAAAPAPSFDPDEEVTIDFAFWGNDVRAELYDEAIAAFNEEYPNITVRTSFLAWTEYWEKRQTEAAGKNLPDVIQNDMNYLRQYDQNGLLLDLTPYLGGIIDDESVPESVLQNGVLDGRTIGIPVSTNAMGMFGNTALTAELGVEPFEGGSWDDYDAWLADAKEGADAAGLAVWGGANYASAMQVFEMMQRAKGEDLFTEDGEVNFTKEDLTEYWSIGQELFAEGVVIPQVRLEELLPNTGMGVGEQATEITWDSMGASFQATLGEQYQELEIMAPPVTVEGAKDLYRKAGMLYSAAATTDAPEASATFIDFLTNSPEVGAIFGTNRGFPASSTQLEGTEITGISAQVQEYEESVADRFGDAPPVPVIGYGPIEQKFREIGTELGFGSLTVKDAVDQFFTEMDVLLAQ
ncbi:MAG: extracellular solute-binding protein [Microbacteriaceae bacterium]